ncbi:hypothetical protein Tco_1128708 [Tanacetum coccineum]
MTGDRSQLTNFVHKFLGTVKFDNDQIAKIMGYGDYQIGNITILRVYYVEGLGHNLFSIGQFCDSDLEAVENVVENESHFSLEVVDQDLSPLATFTIHLMSEQGKRVVRSQWQKRWELRWWKWQAMWRERRRDGEDGGVENKSSMGSRLIATGEIVVERLLEKLVELSMCSPMVERMVDREEKKFLD